MSVPTIPAPKPFVQPGDALPDFLRRFWHRQVATAEQEAPDFRHPSLPLARIKKVMKSDPDVRVMIASDAPILFCKACEIFIAEMTSRAFLIADSNKRRTLSRADIAKALMQSDQFDFLIDIVPREDIHNGGLMLGGASLGAGGPPNASGSNAGAGNVPGSSNSLPPPHPPPHMGNGVGIPNVPRGQQHPGGHPGHPSNHTPALAHHQLPMGHGHPQQHHLAPNQTQHISGPPGLGPGSSHHIGGRE